MTFNWKFLLYMLERLGFDDKWIWWIRGCLVSSRVFVLVNCSPTEEFSILKELRQGNPLAPFLFTMVAKGLSDLMREVKRNHLYDKYLVGKDTVEVNVLQYDNSTIFFGKACNTKSK